MVNVFSIYQWRRPLSRMLAVVGFSYSALYSAGSLGTARILAFSF